MHPVAWLSWVSLVMVLALVTTNPYYLATVLLCVLLVAALAPWSASGLAAFRVMLVVGLGIGVFSIAVATINGASGTHVLFEIPGPAFPDWFGGLRLGGPVTLEALAGASLRALAILCVFLSFAVFNGAVSPVRLLRLAPAPLFHASLVITVGLTLLPSVIADSRRIREMQMLRGATGGLRTLPAIVVPAILGGLDRSLRLAEAMEARGYAASPPAPAPARFAGVAALPLALAAAWLWLYGGEIRPLAFPAGILAAALVVAWATVTARRRNVTRLHHDPVPRAQASAAVAGFALAVALPFLRAQEALGFAYNPFANLPAPEFSLLPASIALLAAWPALFLFATPAEEQATLESPALAAEDAVLR